MAPFKMFLGTSVTATLLLRYFAATYMSRRSLVVTAFAVFALETAGWLIWRCLLYPNFFSPLRTLPGPLGGSFIMGQSAKLRQNPHGQAELYRVWSEEVPHNGIIRYLDMFNSEILIPVSPKALAEILVQRPYEFIKPPGLVTGLGRILGVGVFLAEGEEHKRQRKDLMPAFAFRHVKELYPIFWRKSSELVQALITHTEAGRRNGDGSGAAVDVKDWASRATLDIIGVAGLGRDFDSIKDPDNELIRTYKNIFSPGPGGQIIAALFMIAPWLMRALPIKRNEDFQAASRVIKKTCHSLVRQEKANLDVSKKRRTAARNILSVAIESGGFTDEGLVNQLMTFLIAGHETTASALSFAICMLCQHPDRQRRLRQEIRSGLPDPRCPSSSVSSTDIDTLPYLTAFCNEVLRLYPPVPVTVRVAASDTTLLGAVPIPKGTTLFISPWATNADRSFWGDDAASFDPDRWLGGPDGRAKNSAGGVESNYGFLTFLHGPRGCIGQGFARGELACLLAAWAGAFETRFADEGYVMRVRNGLTPRPRDLEVCLRVLEPW